MTTANTAPSIPTGTVSARNFKGVDLRGKSLAHRLTTHCGVLILRRALAGGYVVYLNSDSLYKALLVTTDWAEAVRFYKGF